MSVKNNCIELCTLLRRRGFAETGMTAVIPEDVLTTIIHDRQWSPLTQTRYKGTDGYLVQFGYLKPVSGGYSLTGEDLSYD